MAAVYGLRYQSRCMSALMGDQDRHCFLVGTQSLRDENEVHLIEYQEDNHEIVCEGVYRHPNEIWSITACPSDPKLLFTTFNAGAEYKAKLWRIPEQGDGAALVELAELEGHTGTPRCVLWEPNGEADQVVSVDENILRLWQLDAGNTSAKETGTISVGDLQRLTTACWDPHHQKQIATVSDVALKGWDLRSMKSTHTVETASGQSIRDVDYNPNKPYHLVTGGDDCKIRFWDFRKPSKPLKVMSGHSHWVWNVKYNRFHDQLVLSSSTDSFVNLWRVVSISSAPLAMEAEALKDTKDGDILIKTFEEHEDSVYSVTWSCCDAWIFASLSYDGRVAINHVPPAEKYKILL
eukprot:GILK01002331.1.p1 GENE.GILK01002331.1~~GILK01002331.1.p1  ORF type:complete len:364 (+),score=57.69 GILK01002331.1:43-1092(+)